MKRFLEFIKRLYNKKIDASGLAIFRILYGIVLLFDVIQIFYFRHLIFDNIPYLDQPEIQLYIPLLLWMITIVFFVFGAFTKYVKILNYIFSLIFIATINTYEYHMYYIYVAVNFILIFVNLSQKISLDNLSKRLKYSNTRYLYTPSNNVSVLNYYVVILVGIGFVYFDSVFYKYVSSLWLNGLGVWLPASVPQITHRDLSLFLNQKWLMIFSGYLTLLFETIFIFIFYIKRLRVTLFIIGVGLHLGIFLVFPIPRFAFGIICMYLLLIPVGFWRYIFESVKFKNPKILFFYDEECPLCNRTRIILNYLDIFNLIEYRGVQSYGVIDTRLKNFSKNQLLDNIYSIDSKNKIRSGIDTYKKVFLHIPLLLPIGILLHLPIFYHIGKYLYQLIAKNRNVERCTEDNCGYIPPSKPINTDEIKITKNFKLIDLKVLGITIGLTILCFLQINATSLSPLVQKWSNKIGFNTTYIGEKINYTSNVIKIFSRNYIGITIHPVFVDGHFTNYNHTIAVVYHKQNGDEKWLPITKENGMLGPWQVGPIWAKWGFRINSANINNVKLEDGIRDFTAFWSKKNEIDLNNTKFYIKVKKNESPSGWEKDFLRNQLDNPWLDGGYVKWENEEYYPNIKNIESL